MTITSFLNETRRITREPIARGVVLRRRPRGFDRAVMILSLAMLRWARRRSDRHSVPALDALLERSNAHARSLREAAWLAQGVLPRG